MSTPQSQMELFAQRTMKVVAGYLAGLCVASLGSMLALLSIAGERGDGTLAEWVAYAAAWTILVAIFTSPFVLISLLIAKLLTVSNPWFYAASAALSGLVVFTVTLGSGEGKDEKFVIACLAIGLVGCLSGAVYWAIAVKSARNSE